MGISALKTKPIADLKVQYCSDKGRARPNNEDYCGYFIPEDKGIKERLGSLFAVSDGVGSSRAGEVASAEAVNVLLQEYYFGDHTEKCPERFIEAYDFTALHIYDLAEMNGSCNQMKCTLTSLLLKDNKFFITHVGDSKAFLLRNRQFIQLTKDHSVVGKLERMGFIT
jgi:serine/threonine protein phosphatase PrpC